jgi:hypothetical protein
MGTDLEGSAVAATGASGPQRAAGAGGAERDDSGSADRSGQPGGAGRGARGVVDGEVIDGTLAPICSPSFTTVTSESAKDELPGMGFSLIGVDQAG